MRSLPTGELGEIAVKGVTFMLGYHKGCPEEYLDRNGYFRTGDSGHLDESGILHWGGRLDGDDQDRRRERVAGGDRVEALALGPAEGLATVVPVPHPLLGEAVVLSATRHDDDPVTTEEILAHLETVPSVVQGPEAVMFVDERELAYTVTREGEARPTLDGSRRRRRVAAADTEWGAYLGEAYPDLVATPVASPP